MKDSGLRVVLSVLLLFIASAAGAVAEWDPRFGGSALGDPGFDNQVYAIVNAGATVYAGGAFLHAGGAIATHVARWDGTSWSRLGPGLSSHVHALTVTSNGNLYAGGLFFTITGGATVNNIARWDGSAWHALDVNGNVGVNQTVNALATAPGGLNVYVGGNFTMAGGWPRNYVALWDGVNWQTVAANSFDAQVRDIVTVGGDVYFGGQFTQPSMHVAHYNGSAFEFINTGPNSTVYAVAVYNGQLHAAGGFTSAGGVPAAGVARWDGSAWHAVATSLSSNYSPPLTSLTVHGTELYLGGGFSAVNGVAANNIARFNGSGWSALGSGVSGYVLASRSVGSELWLGGDFSGTGEFPSHGVARWDGSGWGFGGASDVVRDIAVESSGAFVAAGDFLQSGETAVNRIARFDGTGWQDLGGGVDASARCVASNGTDVYVGGTFTHAGGVAATGIAHWNGSTWSALDYGIQGVPYELVLDGSDLYVGGLCKPYTTPYSNVARWDGAAWNGLGTEYPNGAVRAILVNGSEVIIGGDFTTIGASSISHIAVWDGAAWSPLGTGVDGIVYGVAAFDGYVYAAGAFTHAGGNAANRVARWNGFNWSAMGAGLNGEGRSVRVSQGVVLVGGDFTTAGGNPIANLARWDAVSWQAIGGGTDARVLSLALSPQGLFAVGEFRKGGTVSSDRVGLWTEQYTTPVGSTPRALRLEQNVPNPFNPSTTIRYALDRPGRTRLRIYDVRGVLVRTLVDATLPAGAHAASWDGRDRRGIAVASGVYFYRLDTPARSLSRRMVLLK